MLVEVMMNGELVMVSAHVVSASESPMKNLIMIVLQGCAHMRKMIFPS
jgi:hypothetical protein